MNHPAFEPIGSRPVTALKLQVEEYRHRLTGARHLHLAAADPHNVFLVAFTTVPQDSTGVAHILEHTALCGSRRYPVRDPFFMMTRRSLNTFMNALTGNDWTAYPFASQNRRDFYNLLDVYLDAVFFPRLDELAFAQEGHRLEFAVPDDPGSELVYKGVVFNEMKGALSSPVQRLAQALQTELFPTTTYHYNSGGDPEVIPSLTHAQLKAFHASHYHPANAIFMTYGDIPAADHQARFQEQALAHFQNHATALHVADERHLTTPTSSLIPYPVDGEDDLADKTHVVLGWLLGKTTDARAVMQARLLAGVLLDNSSCPLRHALETSPLGVAPSPLCGFDDSTLETSFVCGLEGSNPEHAQAVEDLILGVIRQVAEQGVPVEQAESALHQLELSQREITGDGFPYGLRLLLEAMTPALHGGDPVAALDIDPLLDELRQQIRDPAFIKSLAHRWLLDNTHRVRVTMAPDPQMSATQAQAERRRLVSLKTAMTAAESAQVVARTQALLALQQQQDDPELLPRVGLQDVPADLRIPQGEWRSTASMPARWYACGTNGMVYQQLVVDLPHLDGELLDLLPLFCACLTEVGSAGRDYLATQARQAAVTGGLSARCLVRGGVDETEQIRGVMILAGKALGRNQAPLTELLMATLTSARFDEAPRLRELIAQLRAQREEGITDHGHLLAMVAAGAGLSPTAALNHRWDGLGGLKILQALDDGLADDQRLMALAAQLDRLRDLLKDAPRQSLVVSEPEQQATIAASLDECWRDLPSAAASSSLDLNAAPFAVQQAWSTSTQVNFCARAYPTVPLHHPDAPALQVLGEFLRNGFLHRAVREQGGAYGAGAGYQADSGVFRLFSYRDPRLTETLEDFDRSLDWLRDSEHSDQSLEEAILGVIAAIDRPGSPAGEAINAFLSELFGRTPALRRAFRQAVLAVSLDDLRRVAATYLRPERAGTAVIANPEILQALRGFELLPI